MLSCRRRRPGATVRGPAPTRCAARTAGNPPRGRSVWQTFTAATRASMPVHPSRSLPLNGLRQVSPRSVLLRAAGRMACDTGGRRQIECGQSRWRMPIGSATACIGAGQGDRSSGCSSARTVDTGRRGGTGRSPGRRYRPRSPRPPPGPPARARRVQSRAARAGRRGSRSARGAARSARPRAGPARRGRLGATGGCGRSRAAARAGGSGSRSGPRVRGAGRGYRPRWPSRLVRARILDQWCRRG